MPSEAEIKAPYIATHEVLNKQYYQMGVITKEEFDQLHGDNWDAMEDELIAEGYLSEPRPPLGSFELSNPSDAPPKRIEHIEDFLERAYP